MLLRLRRYTQISVLARVCGAGNDGVLKQSPTLSGPSLSMPSIIVQLLMIPIHRAAERGLEELGEVWGKHKGGQEQRKEERC